MIELSRMQITHRPWSTLGKWKRGNPKGKHILVNGETNPVFVLLEIYFYSVYNFKYIIVWNINRRKYVKEHPAEFDFSFVLLKYIFMA